MDHELDLRAHTSSCADASTSAFEKLAVGDGFVLVADHDPIALRYLFQAEKPDQFTWESLADDEDGVWRAHIRRTSAAAEVTQP